MATAEASELFPKVEARCRELWPQSFFTPLVMVDWLLQKSHRSWDEFVKHPSFKADSTKIKIAIDEADEDELYPLWATNTGICTSWAVSVAQTFADVKFEYGEKHSHRAAWASNGIVVDSSARNALRLENGTPLSKNGITWEMTGVGSSGSILHSGKKGEHPRPFRVLQDYREAMRCCLRQLLSRKGSQRFHSMYRIVEDGQLRFNGALVCKICPGSCIIAISYDRPTVGDRIRVTIQAKFEATGFEPQQPGQGDLKGMFWSFNETPERRGQFEKIRPILMAIWEACASVYGKPMFEEVKAIIAV